MMERTGSSCWPVLLGVLVQMASAGTNQSSRVVRYRGACVTACLWHKKPPTTAIHMESSTVVPLTAQRVVRTTEEHEGWDRVSIDIIIFEGICPKPTL